MPRNLKAGAPPDTPSTPIHSMAKSTPGSCSANSPRNNVTDSPPLQRAQGWGNLSIVSNGRVGQPAAGTKEWRFRQHRHPPFAKDAKDGAPPIGHNESSKPRVYPGFS